ncbi:DUF6182 family protein [Streptomyces sp. NBC_01190]|uniref:DUF6182 family protein n=1 Tax=Streptomyces sp. NBC_01190 TaxID=2903767 RepID=UPI003865D533|nr:DUF6182 family protein [Streptomyces sp. NBC_01190]
MTTTVPAKTPAPVTPVQQSLREHAATRIRTARPDLAARHDLTSYDGLTAAQEDIAADNDQGTLATVVLRNVDLARWVRDTCVFALGIPPEQAADWRTSFTRTVFLAGNPAHLGDRFTFAHTADDRSAAWTTPEPAARTSSLRRLLKLFDGQAGLPARPDTLVEIPDGHRPSPRPRTRRGLYLATAGCTIAQALVHLNHVLAEAVLDGLITPGDHLVLHQVPRIVGVPGRLARVRVTTEQHLPGRLKAAAALTEEAPVA